MGRRKPRKCRICKKSPVWRGGDVKNPGPFCKRCYHKHVWAGGKGSGRRAADEPSELPEEWPIVGSDEWPIVGSDEWPIVGSDEEEELEMMYWDPSVHHLFDHLPECSDDDEEIPF
jgi:hypothetical protein